MSCWSKPSIESDASRKTTAALETGNASEAYRRSYNTARMKTTTVQLKAKELLDVGKITARLEELREPVREAAQVTLRKHIEDMERLRDEAREAGQYGAAIRAEECRAKASSIYQARVRFKVQDVIADTGGGVLKAIGDGRVTPDQGPSS